MGIFDFIDKAMEGGLIDLHYVLEPDGSHRPARSMAEYLEFMGDPKNSVIASDYVEEVHVSTIFLGLDHSYGMGGPPLLYETMILGGELDNYQKRSFTKESALIEHAHALKEAQVARKTEKHLAGVDPAKGEDKTAAFTLFIDGKKVAELSDVKVGTSRVRPRVFVIDDPGESSPEDKARLQPWFTKNVKKGDAS